MNKPWSVNEAQVLIDNKMYRAAVNRIYYGMFYIVLALGLKYEFETSKHGQLIGWLNKMFIKEELSTCVKLIDTLLFCYLLFISKL